MLGLAAGAIVGGGYTLYTSTYSIRRKILLAENAIQRGNYVLAEHHLVEALESVGEDNTEAKVNILNRLANVYFASQRWDQAVKTFTAVIGGLLAHGRSPEDPAIIEMSLKVTCAFRHQGRTEDALVGADWCIDAAKKKLSATSKPDTDIVALLSIALDERAEACERLGRLEDALTARRESLSAAQMLGPTHTGQLAQCLNNLCLTLVTAGRFQEAETVAAQTCAVARATPALHGDLHIYLANHSHLLALLNRAADSTAKKDEAYQIGSSGAAKAELDEFFREHDATVAKQGKGKEPA